MGNDFPFGPWKIALGIAAVVGPIVGGIVGFFEHDEVECYPGKPDWNDDCKMTKEELEEKKKKRGLLGGGEVPVIMHVSAENLTQPEIDALKGVKVAVDYGDLLNGHLLTSESEPAAKVTIGDEVVDANWTLNWDDSPSGLATGALTFKLPGFDKIIEGSIALLNHTTVTEEKKAHFKQAHSYLQNTPSEHSDDSSVPEFIDEIASFNEKVSQSLIQPLHEDSPAQIAQQSHSKRSSTPSSPVPTTSQPSPTSADPPASVPAFLQGYIKNLKSLFSLGWLHSDKCADAVEKPSQPAKAAFHHPHGRSQGGPDGGPELRLGFGLSRLGKRADFDLPGKIKYGVNWVLRKLIPKFW